MRLKSDWASLTAGSKFTVFALFYFVFEDNFPSTSPRGAYIWRGDLTEGFLRYQFGGLIFGGAYTWRGLFLEFYGIVELKVLDSSPTQDLIFLSIFLFFFQLFVLLLITVFNKVQEGARKVLCFQRKDSMNVYHFLQFTVGKPELITI